MNTFAQRVLADIKVQASNERNLVNALKAAGAKVVSKGTQIGGSDLFVTNATPGQVATAVKASGWRFQRGMKRLHVPTEDDPWYLQCGSGACASQGTFYDDTLELMEKGNW